MKHNGIISKAIKSIERDMRERAKHFQQVKKFSREIDESLFPAGTRFSADYYGIYIYIPWGVDNLSSVRKAIGSSWKFNSKYDNNDGSMNRYYYRSVHIVGYEYPISFQLNIIMDPNELPDGSCRKILVEEKEELVVRKVYKVICDDTDSASMETLEMESVGA